jgi:hypothetical protein
MTLRSPATLWLALGALVLTSVWAVGQGPGALLFPLVYAALVLPGVPLGFALFGRRHPAGWIAGAILGYALAVLGIWAAAAIGMAGGRGFTGTIALITIATFGASWRSRRNPLITLPPWTTETSSGFAVVVALTLILAAPPLANVGARDRDGNLRYRAYFTADFVWHTALTAELTRFTLPPGNPYLAPERMHYYWGYFLVPAAIARSGPVPLRDVERSLRLNALVTGVLLMSSIFVLAFTAVRHAAAAAAGTALALVASSLEGLYELSKLWRLNRPVALVRDVNIDALTAWDFFGHRIDGLPRCLWYVPQHSMAYALGLVALTTATAAGAEASLGAIAIAGVALGGATLINPFVGGIFAIAWGLGVAIDVLRRRQHVLSRLATQAVAAMPVALAVAWCVGNRMVEGAGGALEFGRRDASLHSPFLTLFLSFGPVLVPAAAGALWALRARLWPIVPAAALALLSLFLMYYVRLNVDHEWIPFRAGQMLLAALAVMAAALFSAPQRPLFKRLIVAAGLVFLLAGAPTTVIDAYNARDIDNLHPGPGFHWTLQLSRDQQGAFAWIREHTPRSVVVQMEPMVRQRDSWSLIPTFAQRDMAAGLPISLLKIPEYEARSEAVKFIYSCEDPKEAARIANSMRISYLYVDVTDRKAYPGVAKFDSSPQFFRPVFRSGEVGVYAVR